MYKIKRNIGQKNGKRQSFKSNFTFLIVNRILTLFIGLLFNFVYYKRLKKNYFILTIFLKYVRIIHIKKITRSLKMNIKKYNETGTLFDLNNELNNLKNLFNNFIPSLNTREGDDAYYVDLDLPGVKKEDVKVEINDNVLTVSGKRNVKEEFKNDDYYKVESKYGEFVRKIMLPENIDVDSIQAELENGVLEIVIPKLEKVKEESKKIEIK